MRFKKTTSFLVLAAVLGAGAAIAAEGPKLMPLGDPPIPPDNKQSADKIKLGKMLFWDPRIGGDASTGCVTCHEPDQGWAFSDAFSRGYPGTVHWRNSQTVINSAYLGKQFWVGSASSAEKQARSAARGAVAGNGEADMMEARLAFIPEYVALFRKVFGTQQPHIKDAWRAIASFERTLIHNDTPVDKYLRGDKKALDAAQIRGMKLFNGKAGCVQCHYGPLATDEAYHNLGVPAAERWEEDGLAQITFRFEQYAKGVTQKMYRSIKDDAGLYYRTKQSVDKGKFRTAPLRYTKYTAPYMHNGALWSLREVVEFYNAGGGDNEFAANKSKLMKPLGLSDKEMDDLVAFLEGFSGPELKIDPPKLPDYKPLPMAAK